MQSPGYFFQSVSEALDEVLAKYHRAIPAPLQHLSSEEQAMALVREIGGFASAFLKEGVGVAERKMEEGREVARHAPDDLREMTERALKYFTQALCTPLMPIWLRSRTNGWAGVEPLADEIKARLEAELAAGTR